MASRLRYRKLALLNVSGKGIKKTCLGSWGLVVYDLERSKVDSQPGETSKYDLLAFGAWCKPGYSNGKQMVCLSLGPGANRVIQLTSRPPVTRGRTPRPGPGTTQCGRKPNLT